MSQVRDSTAVKVFGWTITSVYHDPLSSSSSCSPSLRPNMLNNQSSIDNSEQDITSLQVSSEINKESKETSENNDDQQSEITTEEKTSELKKPDKILPCPRCKSSDTKFCYYNNYNVNQPRHFCRNCQRYWTSGGSMRTVPVGSGRRKNKGWVFSDQYLHITSENTSKDSSTKILSFESSESLVTENSKQKSSDVKINADSVSQQELNNFQGLLPPQVTNSVSPPWPYQYPPNASFYHMPVYWGYTVPFWSTLKTSTYLGKRTRDKGSHESVRDAFVKAKLVSQSQSISNESSTHVWFPEPKKHENTEQFSFFTNGSETKSSSKRFVPERYLNLQANPAAMARSMNFRETMQH